MHPRHYSLFWIGYCADLLALSSQWAERDEPIELHPAEGLDMAAWLRLPECQRAAIVGQYVPKRRPIIRYADTEERRRQERAA